MYATMIFAASCIFAILYQQIGLLLVGAAMAFTIFAVNLGNSLRDVLKGYWYGEDPDSVGELAIAYQNVTDRHLVLPLLKRQLPKAPRLLHSTFSIEELLAMQKLVLSTDAELALLAIEALVYVGDEDSLIFLTAAADWDDDVGKAAGKAVPRLRANIEAARDENRLLRAAERPPGDNPESLLRPAGMDVTPVAELLRKPPAQENWVTLMNDNARDSVWIRRLRTRRRRESLYCSFTAIMILATAYSWIILREFYLGWYFVVAAIFLGAAFQWRRVGEIVNNQQLANDPNAIGELARAYRNPMDRRYVVPILKRLLPEAHLHESTHLSESELASIVALTHSRDEQLSLLVVGALERWSNDRALACLRSLAQRKDIVGEAAARAAEHLSEQLEKEKETNRLLRASVEPNVTDELLRPVQDEAMAADELLRSPEEERPGDSQPEAY